MTVAKGCKFTLASLNYFKLNEKNQSDLDFR